MGYVRELVRYKLDGQEYRQAQREAARALYRMKSKIQEARREGRLDEINSARAILQKIGCVWKNSTIYGVTVLTTGVGVVLPYRPDGVLDYRRILRQAPAEQAPLFTD